MIQIEHVHPMASPTIKYYAAKDATPFVVTGLKGTMDEITEQACDMMVKHNFCIAEIWEFFSCSMLTVRLTRS